MPTQMRSYRSKYLLIVMSCNKKMNRSYFRTEIKIDDFFYELISTIQINFQYLHRSVNALITIRML